jgi:uncharacterized MAPEG superfamily protein
MAMSIPVWVLLAFAVWSMLVLTVGTYRWGLIFAGRVQVKEFRADQIEGSDRYRRAMRAHLNCLENLPIYGAIVLVIVVSGARSSALRLLLRSADLHVLDDRSGGAARHLAGSAPTSHCPSGPVAGSNCAVPQPLEVGISRPFIRHFESQRRRQPIGRDDRMNRQALFAFAEDESVE